MSYKFKIGPAILSGSTVMKEALTVEDSFNANSLSASGDIDAGGDLTAGSITMLGFSVDADGDTTHKSIKVVDGQTIGNVSQASMLTFAADGDLTFHDGAFDFDVASHDGTNGLKLGGSLVTSDAAELNLLDGATAGSGVASKALVLDSNKQIASVDRFTGNDFRFSQEIKSSTHISISGSGVISGSSDLQAGGSLAVAGPGTFGGNVTVGAKLVMPDVTAGKILVGDGASFEEVAVSGDVALASNGAMTIQGDAVEGSMLNDNVISGQTELAHADIVDADELMISDGGVLKRVGVDSLRDHFFGVVSGDASIADGGALTIAADSVEGTMLNTSAADGSTMELSSNSLSVLKVPNALSQGDGIAAFSYDGSGALTVALSASVGGAGLAYSSGVLSVDIDELDELDAAPHATQDEFMVSDNGTEKRVSMTNVAKGVFALVTGGDATIAGNGSLTIAADSVEGTMLNTSAADGSTMELSSNSLSVLKVPNALSQGDGIAAFSYDGSGALTVALSASVGGDGLAYSSGVLSLDISDLSSELSSATVADTDEFAISDGGSMKKIDFQHLRDSVFADVSSQASVAAGGALSLTAGAIASQTEMTGDVADADELLISDDGELKRLDFSVLRDAVFADVSGNATVASGGALTIGSGAVEHGMLAENIISGQAVCPDPQDEDLLMIDDGPGAVKKITLANFATYVRGGAPNGVGDANATLQEGVNYATAAITANRAWTLPASAGLTPGDQVIVKAAVVNDNVAITITPAGSQVIDAGAPVKIEEDFAAVTLVYVAVDKWRIV
jgi:cytoskeletal protein CcmA (bactofilin family)